MPPQEDTMVDEFVLPDVPATEPGRELPAQGEQASEEKDRTSVKVAKGIVTGSRP